MRTNFGILILFLFIIVLNFACVSTTSVAQTLVNIDRNNPEINLPANKAADNERRKLIEVTLSTKDPTCVKLEACKVFVRIENVSDQDVEIGGLSFWLVPSAMRARRDFRQDLTSSVDLVTLAGLEPNETGRRLILKSKEHLEKEIDITAVKWKRAILSSWNHEDLWKNAAEGEYQINVSVGRFPGTIDPPRKAVVGGVEVQIVNVYPDQSNDLTLKFTNK